MIYAGSGVGPKSLENTISLLESLISDKYTIHAVDSDTIINRAWLADTALLVMPGGADLPYMEKLGGLGNQNIREYVLNGGKFLGLCAGAYYAADRIEFAKGDSRLEVVGSRELKFFPGLVQGPTYAGFDYAPPHNQAGMRAATIYWQDGHPFANNQKFVVYYNGGGHFVNARQFSGVTILADYAPEIVAQISKHTAIVECKVGKGRAILSGVHFEWEPGVIDDASPRLVDTRSKLQHNNDARLLLARHLLQRLDVRLAKH